MDDGPSTSQPEPATSVHAPKTDPTTRMRTFVQQTPSDAPIYFQIIDLGRQYYVWIATGGARFQELHLAIQTSLDKRPSLANLINGGGSEDGHALAQRLALRLKKPVLCSCNLPANSPILQAIAERRLLQELLSMESEA